MRVFRKEIDILPQFKNGVLTTGTFDGVHTGHQEILTRIKSLADANDGESIILTFDPHPRLVLNPKDKSLKLINTLDEKIELLEHYGIDNLVIAPFSLEFSKKSAASYVKDFLWEQMRPKTIAMGYNHHFGNNREGNIHLMCEMGTSLGFDVIEIEKQMVEHIAVSSTKIRNALISGEIEKATALLGHSYTIKGMVVTGDSRGKLLGFPTANIEITNPNKLIPGIGVYAITTTIDHKPYLGMANIGTRPTFYGNDERIEVHLFDFDQDIYGAILTVEFVAKIREEMKFDSAEDLTLQLEKDKTLSLRLLCQ